MDSDRQISTIVMWTWLAWAGAGALALIGTFVGLAFHESSEARMAAIAIFVYGFLIVAVAVCLTIQTMLRRMTKHILGVMATHDDVTQLHRTAVRH